MSNEDQSPRADRRSYANVLLVQRVLAVLQTVNKLTHITVRAISDECGIPGPSVVRILETLCAEGFLVHMSRRGTDSVRRPDRLRAGQQRGFGCVSRAAWRLQ